MFYKYSYLGVLWRAQEPHSQKGQSAMLRIGSHDSAERKRARVISLECHEAATWAVETNRTMANRMGQITKTKLFLLTGQRDCLE